MDTKLTPPSTPPPIVPNPVNTGGSNQPGISQDSKTDVMGIISIVCAFIGFQLPGFIVGLIGAKKAKEEGRSATLSKVGWILNLVFMILTIIGITLLIVLGTIGANEASKEAAKRPNSAQSRLDDYKSESSAKKEFKKGETAVFGDTEVTITNVARNYVPESKYDAAAAGKELIVLDITVANKADETASVSPYGYKIDNAGVQTTRSYVKGPGNELEAVQLAKGASTSGQVVFEVTADATNLKLVTDDYTYNPKTYRSEKIYYSLEF